MALNRRHRWALFVAIAATGCALLLDFTIKQTAGVALLGVAFAWLLGSVSLRALGLTFGILMMLLGLYLSAAPLWGDWRSVRESSAEYDFAITGLQAAIHDACTAVLIPKGAVVGGPSERLPTPPSGYTLDAQKRRVDLPSVLERWSRNDPQATKWISDHTPDGTDFREVGSPVMLTLEIPTNMSEDDIMRAIQSSMLFARPTYLLGTSVSSHVVSFVSGLALLAFGTIGCLWLLFHGPDETVGGATVSAR